MNGAARYVTGGVYWCTLCNRTHQRIEGSDEYIMKTGWHPLDGNYYNIGFCNGAQTTEEKSDSKPSIKPMPSGG